MTSQTGSVQPPRIAVWLVNLFTPAEQTESILGDLLEEFSHLASKSGVTVARSWYWRQTVKTIAHFAHAGFRGAPWSSAAAVVGGRLLVRFGFMLYGEAMESVLDRYVYEYLSDLGSRHPSRNVATEYMFWIMRGWLVGRVLVATLIGAIVALAAKGREMTVALTLGLFMIALGVVLSLVGVATNGDYEFLFLRALPTVLADAIPIVVGGAIVRTLRSAATTRPSTA
jgi:hypothetical membrane protein